MQGIKKRWVYNYIVLLAVMLLVLEGSFIVFVQNYYTERVKSDITNKVDKSTGIYNKIYRDKSEELENIAKQLIQDTSFKDTLEMQIIDTEGNIIMSSSGFSMDEKVKKEDIKEALENGFSSKIIKKDSKSDGAIVVSGSLKQGGSKTVGVLRYITSLEKIDTLTRTLIATSLIVVFVILLAMLLLSLIFSRSIIKPLNEINEVAKKMANGQFSERVEKRYNDEIGELSDTLNYMAGQIVEATKLKNDFISSISHELRTPLTSIRGWGETILTGGLDDREETELGLKIIVKETTRLSAMVEELLDFSRIESGRITLHLEPVDIECVLSEIVHMFKHRGEKDGVTVEYHHPAFIPDIIGDQNRLRQVFINIIDNAIKFTESGRNVSVMIDYTDEEVYIKVTDEGIGISEEDLPNVKEKFFKGTSKKSGSGIGLAVSNEIIKLHSGTFEIHSEIDRGTMIIIKLPIVLE